MVTYKTIMQEIEDFTPWRGPMLAPGVPGHLHAPVRVFHISYTNNGEHRIETVDCLCGAHLDRAGIVIPTDQPWPTVWAGLRAFERHLADVQAIAAKAFGKAEDDYWDGRANTRS